MKHFLRFLRLASDSRITSYPPPWPAECPAIAMQWVILTGDTCFMTEVVGMN